MILISDFDYTYWTQQDRTKSESVKSESNESTGVYHEYNIGLGDDAAHFKAKVARMEDSEAIRGLKNAVTTAKEAYLANPNVPASRTQLPILEEKIAICESRISDLETENTIDKIK